MRGFSDRTIIGGAALCFILVVGSTLITPVNAQQDDEKEGGPLCGKILRSSLRDLPSGVFLMGSDKAYPEESPQREVRIASFSIDATEVTNEQFAEFVAATEYVTTAERAPDPDLIPKNAPARFKKAGAAVFTKPQRVGAPWWQYVPGASWRHPAGPGSDIKGKGNHPVVQVSHEDALAYATWKGRRLPTEAEWEYAARAGRPPTRYDWGDEPPSPASPRANTWQGIFPVVDTASDGFTGTSPVGCFPPNPWGLYDMIGNVWEWTSTPYANDLQSAEPIFTIRGGSYLCAPNYCARYRPTARQGQEASLPTNHVGFRTASDIPQGGPKALDQLGSATVNE